MTATNYYKFYNTHPLLKIYIKQFLEYFSEKEAVHIRRPHKIAKKTFLLVLNHPLTADVFYGHSLTHFFLILKMLAALIISGRAISFLVRPT